MALLPFPSEEFTDKAYFAVPDDFYRDDLSISQDAWAEDHDDVRLKRRPSVGHRGIQIYPSAPQVRRRPRSAGAVAPEDPKGGGENIYVEQAMEERTPFFKTERNKERTLHRVYNTC